MLKSTKSLFVGTYKLGWLWFFWVGLQAFLNWVMPLFFLNTTHAKVVLITIVVVFATMIFLTGKFGFTRIIGTAQFYWIFMLIWLWPIYQSTELSATEKQWLLALFIVNGLSLIIDAVDMVRYFAGDKTPHAPGMENP